MAHSDVAVWLSEMMVSYHITTWYYNTEDHYLKLDFCLRKATMRQKVKILPFLTQLVISNILFHSNNGADVLICVHF